MVFLRSLWLCFLALHSVSVMALGITPTKISLGVNAPIATLSLSNEKNESVLIQMAVFKWSQIAGNDNLTKTNKIIVLPQIFKLAPHSEQLVRIATENLKFLGNEQSYRLIVEEVSTRTKSRKNKHSLDFTLRLSLPVIIEATGPVKTELSWRKKILTDNRIKLLVKNKGDNVINITSLQPYFSFKKPALQEISVFAYLLPGSEKEWDLNANKSFRLIQATVNNKKIFSDVA